MSEQVRQVAGELAITMERQKIALRVDRVGTVHTGERLNENATTE
jgi:hypothetical protein